MLINDKQYFEVVKEIKEKIANARYYATLKVNSEMIILYYNIGKIINNHMVWGNKFVENLSKDIRQAYPNIGGFSARNLNYMLKFYNEFQDYDFLQQAVAKIPWGHITVLLTKVFDYEEKCFYVNHCIENGWSRNVLVHQIETKLYERQVLANKVTNFEEKLPSPQSEMAVQTLKDPYIFDFIPFKEDLLERDLEQALIKNVTQLLLELGTGFAFLGNQYHLVIGNKDFYIDLLFYNLNLRCYFVVELKTGEFKPEYAGKLNFYLSAVDDILRKKDDNPTIGLLLCNSKDNIIAEYSLRDVNKPMGVSEYKITGNLPKELEENLPSIEDLQNRILK